jgi:hypothetical protein
MKPKEIFDDFVKNYLNGDVISESNYEIRFLYPGKDKSETEVKDEIKEKFMDYKIKNNIGSVIYTIAIDMENNPDYVIITIGF